MVEYSVTVQNASLDQIFHALADTTRRSILNLLKSSPLRVTELSKHFEISLNAVSKHLKVLEKAKLIERQVQGRVHLCNLNAAQLKEIETWMTPYKVFWNTSLDELENYLSKK